MSNNAPARSTTGAVSVGAPSVSTRVPDAPALAVIFRDPDSREHGTIVFVDMQGSTDAKSADVEAKWLVQTGFVYDVVVGAVRDGGVGRIVKFLGDGIMLHYGEDHTAAAINDTIVVQEGIQRGVRSRQVQVAVSIGLATGELVAFDGPSGGRDYLRAARRPRGTAVRSGVRSGDLRGRGHDRRCANAPCAL